MANLNKNMKASVLAIAVAMATPPHYLFMTPATAKALLDADPKLAEQNGTISNPANTAELATRLTDAGMAAATANGYKPGEPAPVAAAIPTFTIANVERPKVNRANESGGSKYPFDQLQNGLSFFIPAPADMKSPSKSFGSLVSGANKRYGTKDNYRRFTTRSMVGDKYGQPGVKGVGVFRMTEAEETAAKAKAFPAA